MLNYIELKKYLSQHTSTFPIIPENIFVNSFSSHSVKSSKYSLLYIEVLGEGDIVSIDHRFASLSFCYKSIQQENMF